MKTDQALNLVYRAQKAGIHVAFIKIALVAEGFEPNKADVIIRWSSKFLEKELDHE